MICLDVNLRKFIYLANGRAKFVSNNNNRCIFALLWERETMASGTLPFDTYHRAQSLGEGTYGYVLGMVLFLAHGAILHTYIYY